MVRGVWELRRVWNKVGVLRVYRDVLREVKGGEIFSSISVISM